METVITRGKGRETFVAEKAANPAPESSLFSIREVRYPAKIGDNQGCFAHFVVSLDNASLLGKPFPVYVTPKGMGLRASRKLALEVCKEYNASSRNLPLGWMTQDEIKGLPKKG